jgi:drug/metabolite transporter (DMT)-like permease
VLRWDVEADVWPFLLASVAFELGYLGMLARAYSRADLSVVYPIARGSAPVLVLAGSWLALADAPSAQASGGVLLVAAGIVLVRGIHAPGGTADVLLALGAGACIAGYTIVDARGLEHADPIPYLVLSLAGAAIPYTASVAMRGGMGRVRAAVTWRSMAAGVAMFAAYGLVLIALTQAPAAPVAAVRETSVVVAAALGAIFLHERVGLGRAVGVGVVALGVAAIALR